MDFKLTEEQELIKKNMREFCEKYVDPIAAEIDENSRHPAEVFQKLAEGDWMGIPIPAQYGGSGADYLTHICAVEELARSCASTGFTVSIHVGIASMLILLFGNEEQKKTFLVPLAKGEKLGAFVLTEPGAGTDVMAATTTAVLDGDHYVINGTKTFTSNGPTGDTYLVFAWTDKAAGRKGMSAFIVPRGTPGMTAGNHFAKMGLRSSQTSEMLFKDCRVPKANLLGKEGNGLAMAMTGFDHGRTGIAAQAVGIIQAALEESVRYAKERVQFGQPIARHQAIAWMIADMATDLNAARFLTYHAAWLKDQGQPFSKEASMAKLFASEKAMHHTIKAVQIQGGYGYCKGAKVERLMRDAKITEIYEGTSEAQRMVISGNVLR
ncbi:MAG TPA: acyl-CoA dehydrogenase family protein [Syntrophales bacterium]|nr:acyl-CoA dehydrogenase family protein [Syntrophales bacterium]HOM06451.1 acyl-CoA dehydrogenase family protein [Syntrophales bacterium]HON99098.1 acyl-CoA dehydrogenase family protein [Syntrophales bacterium]HPC00206.1 acyl-CoA dehydrogenase family protein [Syntrophales bacterium]HPQ05869.1 acyl-CoA dehydrogenase family protein [Syntrophales bacterium]